MDSNIFKKMKANPGQSACVLHAPESYPFEESALQFDPSAAGCDFVHVFVSSRQEFEERIGAALSKRKPDGLFWLSYPKVSGKLKTDINRDIIWDLALSYGIHPVASVSLDDTWSAIRFVDNKPGEVYERPKKA